MILFFGFKFGSMVYILPHEAKCDVRYTNSKLVRIWS